MQHHLYPQNICLEKLLNATFQVHMETVNIWLSSALAEVSTLSFNNISHHIGTMLIFTTPTLDTPAQQRMHPQTKEKQYHCHTPKTPK